MRAHRHTKQQKKYKQLDTLDWMRFQIQPTNTYTHTGTRLNDARREERTAGRELSQLVGTVADARVRRSPARQPLHISLAHCGALLIVPSIGVRAIWWTWVFKWYCSSSINLRQAAQKLKENELYSSVCLDSSYVSL